MKKEKQRRRLSGRSIIGSSVAALLIVCLAISVFLIQDATVFTADGMEFVPELLWGRFAEGTDSASAQATLPHATTAVSGLIQSIQFEPQTEADINVENITLPLNPIDTDRQGRQLRFGEYAVADFSVTAHLLAEAGETMVVFDLKEPSGKLAYSSSTSVAQRANANASSAEDYYLREAVKALHQESIRTAARISCLADSRLADASDELVLTDQTGLPCRNADGYVLLNPGKRELQSYLLAVAEEAAAMGFDTLILDDFGCPASAGVSQEDLLTLVGDIREKTDCTLALMVYPAAEYNQDESLQDSVDELWSCREDTDADYYIDSVGSVSTRENQ